MKISILSCSAIILAALDCVSGQSNTPRCSSLRIRKSVDRISSSEINTLREGYNRIYQLGWTDWFSFLHAKFFDAIHNTPEFLPWHRRFTIDLEDTARYYAPGFTLPYFDAGAVCNDPASSVLFSGGLYGGNGRSGDRCVTDGFQLGWGTLFPNKRCLTRDFSGGSRINRWECPESISNVIQTSNTFNLFRYNLEYGIHASVHNGIGGDMVTANSPNDMIFFLHHANVDRLWLKWQNAHPNIKYEYTQYGNGFDPRANGIPIDNRVSITLYSDRVVDTMDVGYGKFCYAYDDTNPAPRGSGPTKRSDSAISKRDDLIQDPSKVQLVASIPQMSLTSALPPSVLQSLFPLTANNVVSSTDVALPDAVSANAVKFAAAVKVVGNSTDAQLVSSVAAGIDVNNVEGSINADSLSGARAARLAADDNSLLAAGVSTTSGSDTSGSITTSAPADSSSGSSDPVTSAPVSSTEASSVSSASVSSASISINNNSTASGSESGNSIPVSAIPEAYKYPVPQRLSPEYLLMMNYDLGVYDQYYQSRVELAKILDSAGYVSPYI
ncbi:hypothetical protein BB560_007073 [Smittium megazygosporum]|uniref:Tyrosinase copper-binding domain-containing protein n=1 Tax=Smittium megazygosporum TaxID=133381 RepID=A0A2T9XYY4_9FUNG|nr:hypothetical protein BB560_007073 [Smittium megazygosporum]